MLKEVIDNFQKKSLKERFLLVIGMMFFLIYLTFGLVIIFWKELPLTMPYTFRIAFGVILIVYSFLRFIRFFNKEEVNHE
jgi:cytochrome c biogenesis protein CcdA